MHSMLRDRTKYTCFFSCYDLVIFVNLPYFKKYQKSNLLFYSLKIRQKFSKIIFKLEQDHESILIKMFLNYLWIFSTIFTFNIHFTLSISFVDQTSNSLVFMANSLDCVLSQTYYVELIYTRIIAMVILIFLQLTIIVITAKIFCLVKKIKFNNNIISNTFLYFYLYVSNYTGFIKQFCSIISERVISNTGYIQGDVSLLFETEIHWKWIYYFVLPGIGIFGCLIPFSLFFILYIKRNQLDKIQFRKHICYLFNEYDQSNYFQELIKLFKKTIIILIMTYFETNTLLKASLLGLCLLTYQLLATKSKPYIIQNLNILDLQTGQICSIAIFLGAANYVSQQENQINSSVLLQIFLIFLCLRLCYPFVFDIFRVYIKKYKITYTTYLFKLFEFIKSDWCITKFLKNTIKNWNVRDSKLKMNFSKLRFHLLYLSKHQIRQQKQIISLINSQSTRNQALDYERKRLFTLDQ